MLNVDSLCVTSWFQEFRLLEYLEMDLNFAVAGIALGWPCRSVCHRWSTRHGSRGLAEVNGAVKTSENLLCASSLFWAALWKCVNVYPQKPRRLQPSFCMVIVFCTKIHSALPEVDACWQVPHEVEEDCTSKRQESKLSLWGIKSGCSGKRKNSLNHY